MRIYIPATSLSVERLVLDGELEVDHAYAVTPSLRDWYSGDEEELEFIATLAAARDSLSRLGEPALFRRVVLAADLAIDLPAAPPGAHRAQVAINATLPGSVFAAALVDGVEAEPEIKAAVAALPSAGSDDDARFVVEQVQGHELLWFAAQEFPFIF